MRENRLHFRENCLDGGFFLPGFLLLDAEFEVNSAEKVNVDHFFGVRAVVVDCPFVEGVVDPLFADALGKKRVEMFVVKRKHSLGV